MAKPKFTLSIAPTFKAKASIAVPGGKSAEIEFTFKHRSKDDLKEFIEEMDGKEDIELLMDMASGWELDDPFDSVSLEKLTQNYPGSALAVFQAYMSELSGARAKN